MSIDKQGLRHLPRLSAMILTEADAFSFYFFRANATCLLFNYEPCFFFD